MAFMLAFGVFMAVQPSSAQACTYGGCDTYSYNTPIYAYNYPSYPQVQPTYAPLQAQCYPMTLNTTTGSPASWYASAYGGNNSYYYTWTGTDGLTGQGSSVSMTYYTPGYKLASVTVTSGGQTVSKNCDGSVNVTGSAVYYPTYPPTYYSPLSVSCSAINSYTSGYNSAVTWTAYATGGNGNGSYSYSWTGTDGLYGSGQSLYYTYSNPGMKYASVTVYSNGQSITQSCGSGINVGSGYSTGYNYNNYNTYQVGYVGNNSGLDIACYTDPATINANQPVTWTAEVTGGVAPYTYSWTGSDGLTGTSANLVKTYSTSGEKNAIVTVTSADGKTSSKSCTNTLAVRGNGGGSNLAVNRTTTVTNTANTSNTGLSAASLFSLGNIPWGWIAILIILILFATVLYLVFNKPKI